MLELGNIPVILASQSPRRKELLEYLVKDFTVRPTDADELLPAGIGPSGAVLLLARRKARFAAEEQPEALVIGADTMVAAGHEILGKPRDQQDAARMLRLLSGEAHHVYTGVALCLQGRETSFFGVTEVEMAPLTQAEIDWYLSTGEAMDKAGAYGIQGAAARFIRRISGDYFNVMGLPVNALYENMTNFLAAKQG